MKTYIAQRQINHDNQVYEEFHLIDLDDKSAKPLLDIGAVVEKTEVSPMQEQDETKDSDETEDSDKPEEPGNHEKLDEVIDKPKATKKAK